MEAILHGLGLILIGFALGAVACRWVDYRRQPRFRVGGFVDKGGNNPWPPQVTIRPPAPAPLRSEADVIVALLREAKKR